MVDELEMGLYNCRLGVVRFDTWPNLMFDMNQYFDDASLKSAIDNIDYPAQWTRTDRVLNFIRTNQLFGTSHGGRDEIVDILLMITDGESNEPVDTEAALMLQTGTLVFSFGLTGANLDEMKTIASDPDSEFVLYSETFTEMFSYISNITDMICKYGKLHTTSPNPNQQAI